VRLTVTVKPGSKQPGISISGDAVVLRVRERAVEGAANEACLRALAEVFGVPRSRIELVHGARSREKRFAIAGIEEADGWSRLRALQV
jgi:uncharacterized protein YggU (UPF0235/DUF167 family)